MATSIQTDSCYSGYICIFLTYTSRNRMHPIGVKSIWLIVLAPDDGWLYECGTIGMIGRGNWSTRRKPAPVPLCSPQIPHDMTWARTCAAAVGSRYRLSWWITLHGKLVWEWVPVALHLAMGRAAVNTLCSTVTVYTTNRMSVNVVVCD
jgi:hypothetical protein